MSNYTDISKLLHCTKLRGLIQKFPHYWHLSFVVKGGVNPWMTQMSESQGLKLYDQKDDQRALFSKIAETLGFCHQLLIYWAKTEDLFRNKSHTKGQMFLVVHGAWNLIMLRPYTSLIKADLFAMLSNIQILTLDFMCVFDKHVVKYLSLCIMCVALSLSVSSFLSIFIWMRRPTKND